MGDTGCSSLRGQHGAMRYFALALLVCLAPLPRLHAAQHHAATGTLTTAHAIHALNSAEAGRGLPVAFHATVTYFRAYERQLFVQDGDTAISVQGEPSIQIVPGDRVLIKGVTEAGAPPMVAASSITVTGHGAVPAPVSTSFDQLIRGELEGRLVTVYGLVRSADRVMKPDMSVTYLQLRTESGDIDASVDGTTLQPPGNLLDAQVAVTGVASGRFDGKMQQTGVLLRVSSIQDVKVLQRGLASPWALPETPMDQALAAYHVRNFSPRIRIHGTLTYYEPGRAAVLQEGSKSLWVTTSTAAPLHVGNLADATGFPDVRDGFIALTDAAIRDSDTAAPIAPVPSTWTELSSSQRLFNLVSIDGQVVAEVRGAAQDEYVLVADHNLFTAIYRHPPAAAGDDPPPMKHISIGSRVRVTGICVMNGSNPANGHASFNILLRSADDVAMLAQPSWRSVATLFRLVLILLVVVLVVGIWVGMLRRKVHEQTAAITAQVEAEAALERRITHMEQWRSRILEDINSSMPLAEILEHITSMVSFCLNGAPCWCEIADGAKLGKQPKRRGLRLEQKQITSRAGGMLGTLYAAFETPASSGEQDTVAMATGARLATLAIETRKLYSDLVHRSEFDLLTDVYNRFSLDRFLQEQIEKAREKASIFGLIYVDLDNFKQVNDVYGHHVGDLYLQEVAVRMRRQLRTSDMLARLGGDEFAALVPVVRSQADVEEIAQRMERCFDSPVSVEGHLLYGSASIGIALYPADGTTAESLLRAADGAMYVAKHTKRAAAEDPHGRRLGMNPQKMN